MTSPLPIVVLITHHANDMLWSAIESILRQQQWIEEVWVVHSHEQRLFNFESVIEQHTPFQQRDDLRIRYHWLGDNFGFATAVNWALEQGRETCRHPLFILNDDTVLNPQCLERLCNFASTRPNSILQPDIWLMSTASQRVENSGHKVALDGSNYPIGRGKKPISQDGQQILCFSGAAFWVPPAVYTKPGLTHLDTDLSPFGEDLDYALRCIRSGVDIFCVHNASLQHRWGGSFGRYSAQKVKWIESHRIQSKFRNLPLWMICVSPLSSVHRYLGNIGNMSQSPVPSGSTLTAIQATLTGTLRGYTAIPRALRKRFEDRAVEPNRLSDWAFTKKWWMLR